MPRQSTCVKLRRRRPESETVREELFTEAIKAMNRL